VVIALAELNRWHGGWFAAEPPLPTPEPAGTRVYGVYHNFRLGVGYYREQHSPSAEACVAACKAEPAAVDCGGMVFKESTTPGGTVFSSLSSSPIPPATDLPLAGKVREV
jgi:hypothetical protein